MLDGIILSSLRMLVPGTVPQDIMHYGCAEEVKNPTLPMLGRGRHYYPPGLSFNFNNKISRTEYCILTVSCSSSQHSGSVR